MRAARIHRHGGPEELVVEEVPEPVPGPHDLLVRIRATSVNFRDLWIRQGHPHPAYRVPLPQTLGIDVCGEVEATGSEVEGFAPGDRVTANPYLPCGTCEWCRRDRSQYCPRFSVFNGSYAELALVPARSAVVVGEAVPDELLACFPNTYVTAWQMLQGKVRVGPSDVVFVWAGTSGLGSAAVDIARLAGATVIASAGTEEKRAVLQQLGPALVVDHHDPGLVAEVADFTGGRGVDVVFEHIGRETWGRSLELCGPGGTIVSAGATTGDAAEMDVTAMFAKQVRILGSRLGTLDDTIAALAALEAGRLRPLVALELPLAEVAEGHRLLEAGGVSGKIVVRP